MILKEFNTLYKRVHNGEMINVKGQKMQQWNIWVEDKDGVCTIYTSHGQVGGKIAEDKGTVIKGGKNLGRANATTVQEQAIREAQSKYDKKKDEGYTESIEEARTKIYWFPMLAKQYAKATNLDFPYILQNKLEGVRAWAYKDDNGEILLMSRKREFFVGFPLIREALKDMPQNYILDGELYTPKTVMSFQKLCGVIKREKDRDLQEEAKIDYYSFDLFDKQDFYKSFSDRYSELQRYVEGKEKIKLVKNLKLCKTKKEVEAELLASVGQGYEGIMLRKDNKYTLDFRTSFLLKYKTTEDKEFEVVSFEEGKGNYAGTPVWICKTESGEQFNVPAGGTVEDRQELFPNAGEYIGKMITVRFQSLTDRGVPLFPRFVGIRDYE